MSAAEVSRSSSDDVVDLRVQRGAVTGPAAEVIDPADRLRRRRRLIVVVFLGIFAVFVWDVVAGRVVHDQRQRHLAFDVTQPKRSINDGEAFMLLQVPRIGVNTVVAEGSSTGVLRSGPGHVAGTATPGERGNSVVVGRRSRYAGPFGELGTLKSGDQIVVKTRAGLLRGYTVERVVNVDADSRAPLASSKVERLTLVGSAPGVFADRLIMVTAKVSTGPQPTTMSRKFAPKRSALDDRPVSGLLGALLLLLVLAAMVVAVVIGGAELRRRYSQLTVATVLLPVVGLLALVVVFALDTVLPATL